MQEAIQQERDRFRDVANNTGDWIWEIDADGKYTFSSPVVEQILGYKPEEVIGRKMLDFVPPEDMKEKTVEPTSVGMLVNGVFAMIAIPRNVQVITEIDNERKMIVDVDKMKRVFLNIIKNSLEAMPNGGKLTITTQEADGNIQFLFADTGVGMTKETLDKLWTPLFTTKARGMGFGLSICKRIIDAHAGKISVQSVFGQGTTFTITVPIKPEHERGVEVWVNAPEYFSSTMIKL
jgi:signal transduction histidine kinase